MRTVHESTDLLVIAESANGMRICGGAIAIVGSALLAAGIRGASVVASLVGILTVSFGGALLFLPAITIFSFSRGENRLTVARRRLWNPDGGEKREEYPLRDVAAVQVDESRGEDGSTWRVIVRMSNGHIVPFTSYYTSGLDSKLAFAQRIGRFLGVSSTTQSVAGQASPHAIVKQSRGATIGVAMLVTAFGLLFGSIGGAMLVRETRRMSDWQPVQATVLETSVDTHYDSDGSTYLPVIVYRYSVAGRTYTSSRALPINESRSGRWAYRVTARFVPGGTYTAWYDPTNPSDAFIVRSSSIVAPIFAAIGAVGVIAGLAIGYSARREL